jgi:hypothetical protein
LRKRLTGRDSAFPSPTSNTASCEK